MPNIVVSTCREGIWWEINVHHIRTNTMLFITNQYRSTDLHLKTHTTHRPYTEDVRTCTNTVFFFLRSIK